MPLEVIEWIENMTTALKREKTFGLESIYFWGRYMYTDL